MLDACGAAAQGIPWAMANAAETLRLACKPSGEVEVNVPTYPPPSATLFLWGLKYGPLFGIGYVMGMKGFQMQGP